MVSLENSLSYNNQTLGQQGEEINSAKERGRVERGRVADWRRANQEKERKQIKEESRKEECRSCIEKIEVEAESSTEAQKTESR